jgi:hypothetical protein
MSAHKTADPQVLVPTSIERVQFHDGQLVDAEALTTAMMFPVSLLQLVLRSYLGCGIVCGLEVIRPDEERPCVRIRPGVIVDCHGSPVELCREVVLDLTPDPCACETEPRTLCIVMRRATSEDAPRQPCGCGCGCGGTEGSHHACNRVRDQVLIKAVDLERLDPVRDHVCSKLSDDRGDRHGCGKPGEPQTPGLSESGRELDPASILGPGSEQEHPGCLCLMACAERCCAERSWVLLGCITISPADGEGCASGYTLSEVDPAGRRYVKPIECCRSSHLGERSTEQGKQEEPVPKKKTTSDRRRRRPSSSSPTTPAGPGD